MPEKGIKNLPAPEDLHKKIKDAAHDRGIPMTRFLRETLFGHSAEGSNDRLENPPSEAGWTQEEFKIAAAVVDKLRSMPGIRPLLNEVISLENPHAPQFVKTKAKKQDHG